MSFKLIYNNSTSTEIFLNRIAIPNAVSAKVEVAVGELPKVTLELCLFGFCGTSKKCSSEDQLHVEVNNPGCIAVSFPDLFAMPDEVLAQLQAALHVFRGTNQ